MFTAIADALEWVLRERGVTWCIHYIDDFLTAGPPDSNACHVNLDLIKQVCAQLGFPLKWEKVEGPACVIDHFRYVTDGS